MADLEMKRDTSQCIVVVDCDAFYASVEELDNPSLKGKAFAVGEGVLTTASYEARKYGCVRAFQYTLFEGEPFSNIALSPILSLRSLSHSAPPCRAT